MHEVAYIFCGHGIPLTTLFMLHKITQMLKHLTLLVYAEYNVHPQLLGEFLGRELRITARNHHICTGILAHQFMYHLTALLLGLLCHSTAVDNAYICLLAALGGAYTGLLQLTLNGCSLREIQLTT